MYFQWGLKNVCEKGEGVVGNQVKVLTGSGDLREAQVDVPLSVSHSCV